MSLKNFTPTEIFSPDKLNNDYYLKHWNIVPSNTWHFPEAGKDEDWLTVTFHSAASEHIIDDYKDFPAEI